jgi:hypothetical protein
MRQTDEIIIVAHVGGLRYGNKFRTIPLGHQSTDVDRQFEVLGDSRLVGFLSVDNLADKALFELEFLVPKTRVDVPLLTIIRGCLP